MPGSASKSSRRRGLRRGGGRGSSSYNGSPNGSGSSGSGSGNGHPNRRQRPSCAETAFRVLERLFKDCKKEAGIMTTNNIVAV